VAGSCRDGASPALCQTGDSTALGKEKYPTRSLWGGECSEDVWAVCGWWWGRGECTCGAIDFFPVPVPTGRAHPSRVNGPVAPTHSPRPRHPPGRGDGVLWGR
jgi:hypothetical protein